VLSRDTYCVTISLCPRWSVAQYFDSSNTTYKKDWGRIKTVLNDALEGYFQMGGTFEKNCAFVKNDKRHGFRHVTEFPCIKQPADSVKDAFYALHQLKGIVRDAEQIKHPSSIREMSARYAGDINDADLREDFHRIQRKLSEIIIEDVETMGGCLNIRLKPSKRSIEKRLDAQGDRRTWMMKDMYKPFPAPFGK
jgi:hypothetical protein